MNLVACAKYDKATGELVKYANGRQELEINLSDINSLSDSRDLRLIGIDKEMYRLTNDSYKKVKRELEKSKR